MTETAITIWPFEDAPEHLRQLSTNGGDEDYLIIFPPGMTVENMPWQIERAVDALERCETSYYDAPDGRLIAITCHA